MHCPFCQQTDTKVLDSRLMHDGTQVKRRRACMGCQARFNTFERIECVMPRVIKRDGVMVTFDEAKLRSGLIRAFKKRPLSDERLESLVIEIMRDIRTQSAKEVSSARIGELVMSALKSIDAIAYMRFASVYDGFSNIEDFQSLIQQVATEQVPILEENHA